MARSVPRRPYPELSARQRHTRGDSSPERSSEELDFRLEAANMLDVARCSRRPRPAREFVVPRPHPDFVTERILVMRRLDGFGSMTSSA
ncbi:MAG: AarF/UbiB family protein [Acidimicrobiales bacterium]